MDIPLPEDDPPVNNESLDGSLADIPVPEDTNRYSPSLPIEDDSPDFKNDISTISLPSDTQKLSVPPTVSVLGKEAAKKRLLAFSQAKQSFISQKRKPAVQAVIEGNVLKDNDAKTIQPKKKKKGVLDKARDIISEIEELKRRENEVMETMHVLFPMWGNLEKKATPVTSLIIQDGIAEKPDKIETVVEKLLSKKSKLERKELERLERLEDRRRRRERREKEIRRLMPKSWDEFKKSGFKACQFRHQKLRLEKLSEGMMKPKERTRSHEHEREGSKRFNLLDTPMVLKKLFVAKGLNNEDVEFPSWAIRYTNSWPSISYCINPKYVARPYVSRREMFSTLPDNIYAIIKRFFSTTYDNKINEENTESKRSWWKRDLFLIPNCPSNNSVQLRNDTKTNDHTEDIFEANLPDSNELNDFGKADRNDESDKNSTKSLSDSVDPSSEGPNSDVEKSYSSELSEIEEENMNKGSSARKEENQNEGNLASEYEQFIKTIGPNTDHKEVSERTGGRGDEIWSEVSEEKEIFSESSAVATKKKLDDRKKNKEDKKIKKDKRKKVKRRTKKRSHSSDSSSSESSSSSSSISSDSSSTTSSSSSSSSSSSTSSSSSSSSGSTSSSNDSSSESSSSTSSTGSTTSSDSQSFERKTRKKLRRKRTSKKKMISSGKNKSKKMAKVEIEDDKAFVKKKKKRKEDLVNDEGNKMSDYEPEAYDTKNLSVSSGKSFAEFVEGDKESLTGKGEIVDPSVISMEKVVEDEIYEPRDSSPQSRTSDEAVSPLSNSSLKSITSEPMVSNEQKDTNNSLRWNSGEESVSNLPMEQEVIENDSHKPPEGKRHFNIDMFQESHNCTPDLGSARESSVEEKCVENLVHSDTKVESKEENDNTNSRVLSQSGEESALKSLEKYSPTAEDDDEEEYEDFLTNNASGGGSTLDEASQLVSFGVNSASEEARMLDIPLPPPIEAPSEAPTSFRNILQLPSSPNQLHNQSDVKKKNVVLVGKSPVARLTFGKQVMKLKPISIFSTEDSDSEVDKTPFPLSAISETNDASSLSWSGRVENKEENHTQERVNCYQINNEVVNNQIPVSDIDGTSDTDMKPVNAALDSSSPQSKKSRWDQETSKSEERDCIGDVAERSLLINPVAENIDNSERKVFGYQSALSVPEFSEKIKGKARKEDSRSPLSNDKKRRRERSHSSERDRRRRERAWSPRDRGGRFSRDRRRDFRKRSRSKERRNRRDSPHREFSPNWRKVSPQMKSSRRSPSQEKSQRTENVTNHELPNEASTTLDSSWNKSEVNLNQVKDSFNSSPKKKELLCDWDSPERKYSPSRKESPKRKRSPVPRDSPFRSPRRKESPLRNRTPENRRESPNRRYSPRRSPLHWNRSSPDRRRSPYSPRRSSPLRRRVSPDRKRSGSPYRGRLSPSPEHKYSGRHLRKSPIKHQGYSSSPSREEKWKWEEEKGTEKIAGVENERFPKWDYEEPPGDGAGDYQTSLADSTISDSELVKEPSSPKRMSLDERLKIELGHSSTNIEPEQPQSMPPFHNFYYPPPTVPDQVGYFPHQQYNVNAQPPPCLPPDWNPSLHPPQIPNKLVQVGNVLQVVPTEIPVESVYSAPPPKIVRNVDVLPPKVLQVGNVLQVVPSQEPPPPPPPSAPLQFNPNITPPSPVAAPIPKMTAPPPQPAPPVSIISLPFPPGSPNVFLKLEEKERRKKEKELRKEKKEQKAARRMLRKAMLKKRLAKANEPDSDANTCTTEAVNNESGEIYTSKPAVVLPSPDKGILIGLKDTIVLTSTKKKSVSFADGIKPGEGTSPSGGEEHPLSPPPLIRKAVKKRKKRKVKVRIIRIDSNSKEEESEEDELSPPPPPPGTPPPEAYIEYTASGRYLYPLSAPQPFSGNQDGGTVFPPLPAVTASPAAMVQFPAPPLPQQR